MHEILMKKVYKRVNVGVKCIEASGRWTVSARCLYRRSVISSLVSTGPHSHIAPAIKGGTTSIISLSFSVFLLVYGYQFYPPPSPLHRWLYSSSHTPLTLIHLCNAILLTRATALRLFIFSRLHLNSVLLYSVL